MLAWVFVLIAAAFFLCGSSYHTPTTRVVVLRPTFPVFFFPCPCSILSNEISLLLSPAVVNPTGTTRLGATKRPGANARLLPVKVGIVALLTVVCLFPFALLMTFFYTGLRLLLMLSSVC